MFFILVVFSKYNKLVSTFGMYYFLVFNSIQVLQIVK